MLPCGVDGLVFGTPLGCVSVPSSVDLARFGGGRGTYSTQSYIQTAIDKMRSCDPPLAADDDAHRSRDSSASVLSTIGLQFQGEKGTNSWPPCSGGPAALPRPRAPRHQPGTTVAPPRHLQPGEILRHETRRLALATNLTVLYCRGGAGSPLHDAGDRSK